MHTDEQIIFIDERIDIDNQTSSVRRFHPQRFLPVDYYELIYDTYILNVISRKFVYVNINR